MLAFRYQLPLFWKLCIVFGGTFYLKAEKSETQSAQTKLKPQIYREGKMEKQILRMERQSLYLNGCSQDPSSR